MKIQENVQVPKEKMLCDITKGTFFRFVNEITGYQYGLGLRLDYTTKDIDDNTVDIYNFEQELITRMDDTTKVIPINANKIHITIDRLNEEK